MGKSRASEHQAFFLWLLEQIRLHEVDALIVAGDIFDSGAPPSYAREMYNQFIVDIHNTGCQLIILAGNHDSVATLNESKALLACLNTRVVSCVADECDDFVFPLKTRQGDTGAILCAIPFIRPRDVIVSQAGQSGQEKQQVMQQAIADYYQKLYQQATKLQKASKTASKQAIPIIATGHLTTVGASTSDSVRDIYIGTLDAFPASAFPPADYIALGHIHKPQKVAKSEHIRYSGSPLALSFDEAKTTKSVLLVDFKAGKFLQAKPLDVPKFQAMEVIKGDLKEIKKQLNALPDLLGIEVDVDREDENQQRIWVEILVSSQDYLNDLQTRIQTMLNGLPIDVLRLRRERKKQPAMSQGKKKETLAELSVMDVFERRLSENNWESKADKETRERIRSSFQKLLGELDTGKAAP